MRLVTVFLEIPHAWIELASYSQGERRDHPNPAEACLERQVSVVPSELYTSLSREFTTDN